MSDSLKESPIPSKSPSPMASPRLENNLFSVANLLGDKKHPEDSEKMKNNMIDQLNEYFKKVPAQNLEFNPFLLWGQLGARMFNSGGLAPNLLEESKRLGHLNSLAFAHLNNASGSSSGTSDPGKLSRESSNASPVHSDHSSEQNDDDGRHGHLNGIRKKKTRTVFSRSQVSQLEMTFNQHKYLNTPQRSSLAAQLGLTDVQVKIWFQNRRNKWKRTNNGEDINASAQRPQNGSTIMSPLNSIGSRDEAMRLLLQQQSPFAQNQFLSQQSPLLSALPFFNQLRNLTVDSEEGNLDVARFFALQAQNFMNTASGSQSNGNSSPAGESADRKEKWNE
ncbi:unnamed protein product [Bursaphelenchus xylophilus]|uniref:(pine wood nematode) hypothetical protein n=1 Tax=Bursaphelenchus xylophilus TaxID=6326 RepID=A0A1I7SU92_BURXY|nr:unnamed protein product [Bursaphelenchus xylophilus]CAG9107421.1 unnamed protein product [Bursaphelenchus xylophilus]